MPVPDGVLSKASFTPLSAAWATSRFTAPWCHSKTAQLKNSSQRKPLSPSFSHRNPPQKTPPRAQIGFLVGQKQHWGLCRHFRARHGVPEWSTSGAAKTRELTLPSTFFFLLKKLPWRRYTSRAGGFMNMLLCAAVTVLRHTSVSGVLAFLLIGPISENKKKMFKMHHCT